MRPTRSRKYCRDCGFRKIHFKTEEKALSFIRFNQREIQEQRGYSLVRAYYCQVCGCWHVTSHVDPPVESFTQKVVKAYAEQKTLIYSTPREMGLSVVDDKDLKKIVDRNLGKPKATTKQQVPDKQERLLKKQRRWLTSVDKNLADYECRFREWKETADLIQKCETMKRTLTSYPTLPCNKQMIDSFIERLDHIIETYNIASDLINKVTLGLQDTSSYLSSKMYAHARYTLNEVLKSWEQLYHLEICDLANPIQHWGKTADAYRQIIVDNTGSDAG